MSEPDKTDGAPREDSARLRVRDPLLCKRCASLGPTCCRIDPMSAEYLFPLSDAEYERILAEVGPELIFSAERANTAGFQTFLRSMFPARRREVAALFPIGLKHRRLAVTADGACVLLGSQGCVLPREARPFFCRIFPFWLSGGRMTVFDYPGCLGQREFSDPGRLLVAMGLEPGSLRRLHADLCQAWGLSG